MKKSIIIIILCALVAVLSFFIGKNYSRDSSFSNAVQDYLVNREEFLVKNYQPIDIEAKYPNMGIMEDNLKSYNTYLYGGNSGNKANNYLEKYFIRYFVEKQGVKNVILDLPYSVTVNINKYLETGDKSYIKSFSEYMLLSSDYKLELNRNWDDIKKYYDYLPKDDKFKITGFNMNINPYYTTYILKNLITGKDTVNLPLIKNLQLLADESKGEKANEEGLKKLYEISSKIKDEIDKNDNYKAVFKDDFLTLKILTYELNESTNSIINKYSKEDIEKADEAFLKKCYPLYKSSNGGKYFGSLDIRYVVNYGFEGSSYKMGALFIKDNRDNPKIFNDLSPYISEDNKVVTFRTKGKYSPFNFEKLNILSDRFNPESSGKISANLDLVTVIMEDRIK